MDTSFLEERKEDVQPCRNHVVRIRRNSDNRWWSWYGRVVARGVLAQEFGPSGQTIRNWVIQAERDGPGAEIELLPRTTGMTPILCPGPGFQSFIPFLNRRGHDMSRTYRAAVIGATGMGGYGHRLDAAFLEVEGVELVAVADGDPTGLEAAGERLGVSRLYRDYRRMLETELPDFVCIAPSWVTERVPMVESAAAARCHIYCEKPAAGSLAEADRIEAACRRAEGRE